MHRKKGSGSFYVVGDLSQAGGSRLVNGLKKELRGKSLVNRPLVAPSGGLGVDVYGGGSEGLRNIQEGPMTRTFGRLFLAGRKTLRFLRGKTVKNFKRLASLDKIASALS